MAALLRAAEKRNVRALEEKPELYEDLFEIWQGFFVLNKSRQFGFDMQPLSVTDIVSYYQNVRGYDEQELYEAIRLTQSMDTAYMDNIVKQRKKDKSKAGE